MRQIEALPVKEQEELFVLLTQKVVGSRSASAKRCQGKMLSFEEACEVFSERTVKC